MRWYPLATRDPGQDGGAFVDGYARKGVIHTTEGTTYGGARAAYHANRSWPHLTCSYEHDRFECWQHLSVDRAARALRNPPGGVETNRGGAVQLEIVATSDLQRRGQPGWLYVEDLPAGYLEGIARLMRWLEASCGIRRRAVTTWLPYPQSYGAANGLRLGAADWRAFAGWLGHCHVPENTHGDPGNLPIHRLLKEDPMSDIPTLIQVVKDQTGALYQQRNVQHGDLMRKLDALPAAIAAAVNTDCAPQEDEEPPAR